MTNIIVYFIIGLYLYGWYYIFFVDRMYMDDAGNQLTKKEWKQLQKMNQLYH